MNHGGVELLIIAHQSTKSGQMQCLWAMLMFWVTQISTLITACK